MFRKFFTVIAFIALSSSLAHAQDRWQRIATSVVDLSKGTFSIDTRKAKGRFSAFKIVARKGNIVLTGIALTYADGRVHKQGLPAKLSSGAETQPIDPQKKERFIDRVDLAFKHAPGKKMVVEVVGFQSKAGARAKRPKDEPELLLASRRVKLDAARRVQVRKVKIAGAYEALRVRAVGNNVLVRSLTVIYTTGKTEQLKIEKVLKSGSFSPWLKLSKPFPIAEIFVSYAPAGNAAGSARISVYGRPDPKAMTIVTKPKIAYKQRQKGKPKSRPRPLGEEGTDDDSTDLEERVAEFSFSAADCVTANVCTPVRIYFGTNRKREDTSERIAFGPERESKLTLGEAIVTVPRGHHTVGEVERPSYWSFTDWYRFATGAGEDPAKHFVIPANGMRIYATHDEFIAAIRAAAETEDLSDHAFIYIHGFNTEFDGALYRLAQMSYDLGTDDAQGNRVPFGRPFLFSWPSRGGTFGIKNYVADGASAEVSELYLRQFLELVVTRSGITNIHVIAHSMGNRPLLNVLEQFAYARHPEIKFNQIILAAPDVDKERFLQIAAQLEHVRRDDVAAGAPPLADNITLYASSTDKALSFSSDTVHAGYARAGFVSPSGPVVTSGIETVDISSQSTDIFGLNHNAYAQATELLVDMTKLMGEGLRPPHLRIDTMEQHPAPGADDEIYWVIPPPPDE